MNSPSLNHTKLLKRRELKPGLTYVPVAPNGKAIEGTYEKVPGTSMAGTVTITPDGAIEPEYEGETRMDWDSQSAVRRRGQRLWVDEDGHLWGENAWRFREGAT